MSTSQYTGAPFYLPFWWFDTKWVIFHPSNQSAAQLFQSYSVILTLTVTADAVYW